MTIIAFAAIFAGAGLLSQPGTLSAVVATLGVAGGSLLWWLALVSAVAAVRHAVNERTMLIVNRVSGLVLIAFGALALVTGLAKL
jgi:putative LysE/RhtB family amino acid efflux pump